MAWGPPCETCFLSRGRETSVRGRLARRRLVIADDWPHSLGDTLAEIEYFAQLAVASVGRRPRPVRRAGPPPPSCRDNLARTGARVLASHAPLDAAFAAGQKRMNAPFWFPSLLGNSRLSPERHVGCNRCLELRPGLYVHTLITVAPRPTEPLDRRSWLRVLSDGQRNPR
jgi:hypothetical protein